MTAIPVHKAGDGVGVVRAICGCGGYQLAEQWANVTCPECLAYLPSVTVEQAAREPVLTEAEREALTIATCLAITYEDFAERLIEGREPPVIEAVQRILADHTAALAAENARLRAQVEAVKALVDHADDVGIATSALGRKPLWTDRVRAVLDPTTED